MTLPRSRVVPILIAVLVLVTVGVVARPPTAFAAAGSLQVWNYNTALMSSNDPAVPPPHGQKTDCSGPIPDGVTDFEYFLDYITDPSRVSRQPDVVTLQETGTVFSRCGKPFTTASCKYVTQYLQARSGHPYYCFSARKQGGAAIVYRGDRLSHVGDPTLTHLQDIGSGSCTTANEWYSIELRLVDDVTGDHVNVASTHLPTVGAGTDDDCSWPNVKNISAATAALGTAQMQLFGGDWNHADAYTTASGGFDGWTCVYRGTNYYTKESDGSPGECGGTNLGWKDVAFQACGSKGTQSAIWACTHANHWSFARFSDTHCASTSEKERVDFLFVKAYSIHEQQTVKWADAYGAAGSPPADDLCHTHYSDHRGQGGVVTYLSS